MRHSAMQPPRLPLRYVVNKNPTLVGTAVLIKVAE